MKFTFSKLADKLVSAAKLADAAVQKHVPLAAKKIDSIIETAKPRIQVGLAHVAQATATGTRKIGRMAERIAADLKQKAEAASYVEVPTKPTVTKGLLTTSTPTPSAEPTRIYVQICAFDSCFAQAIRGGTLCVSHALATAANGEQSKRKTAPCLWHSCSNDSATGSMFCNYHFAEHIAFRNRHCGKKIKHQSIDSAVQHATALASKEGAAFAAYQCELCNAFHVGHDRENTFQN